MHRPRFIFRERLWVGTRPGDASGGVAAAAAGGGETAPVLLLDTATAVATSDGTKGISLGSFPCLNTEVAI